MVYAEKQQIIILDDHRMSLFVSQRINKTYIFNYMYSGG